MSRIKLPTNAEINQAFEGYVSLAPPQPLAAVIDRHGMLSDWVKFMSQKYGGSADVERAIKAAVVFGLNIGIRIGEKRGAEEALTFDG